MINFIKRILFPISVFTTLVVVSFLVLKFSNQQIFAETNTKVGETVSVNISFTAPSKAVTLDFKVKITGPGQLQSLVCVPSGSTFSKIFADTTNCSLAHFDGGSTGEVVAVATVKATDVGTIKVVGDGVVYDIDGNSVSGAEYIGESITVIGVNPPPGLDPASCFGDPFLYKKSPYEYKVNQSMSIDGSGDWVKFPLNPDCRNKAVLEGIFGPLDEFNGGKALITKPNQEFQYGFTFNRIVAIEGYDTNDIKAGQPGQVGLTEQQLHDLHYAGKDTQSIENCDKNAVQFIFDLEKNEAKPNMANYAPVATGYYQFDITPKFKCSGNNPNQQSLGAGFVRVVDSSTPIDITCKSLVAVVKDSSGKVYDLASLPKDFVGKVTLICEGKSKGKDINFISFKFKKGDSFISATEGTVAESIIPTTCTDAEISSGYKCVIGSGTFDITGTGNYSASSKVCVVEGEKRTCSPNENN